MVLFNWRKNYTIQVRCLNCNQTDVLKIPKGSLIDEYVKVSLCENCGCNTLRRIGPPVPLPDFGLPKSKPIVKQEPKQEPRYIPDPRFLDIPEPKMDYRVPQPNMNLGIPKTNMRTGIEITNKQEFLRHAKPKPNPELKPEPYYYEPEQQEQQQQEPIEYDNKNIEEDDDINNPKWVDS